MLIETPTITIPVDHLVEIQNSSGDTFCVTPSGKSGWNDYHHISSSDFPSIYDFDFSAELVIYIDNLRLTSDEELNRMNKYKNPNNKLSQ
jgi:hypothetical protein